MSLSPSVLRSMIRACDAVARDEDNDLQDRIIHAQAVMDMYVRMPKQRQTPAMDSFYRMNWSFWHNIYNTQSALQYAQGPQPAHSSATTPSHVGHQGMTTNHTPLNRPDEVQARSQQISPSKVAAPEKNPDSPTKPGDAGHARPPDFLKMADISRFKLPAPSAKSKSIGTVDEAAALHDGQPEPLQSTPVDGPAGLSQDSILQPPAGFTAPGVGRQLRSRSSSPVKDASGPANYHYNPRARSPSKPSHLHNRQTAADLQVPIATYNGSLQTMMSSFAAMPPPPPSQSSGPFSQAEMSTLCPLLEHGRQATRNEITTALPSRKYPKVLEHIETDKFKSYLRRWEVAHPKQTTARPNGVNDAHAADTNQDGSPLTASGERGEGGDDPKEVNKDARKTTEAAEDDWPDSGKLGDGEAGEGEVSKSEVGKEETGKGVESNGEDSDA